MKEEGRKLLSLLILWFWTTVIGLENCCEEVLISSSGPGFEYQRDRLGVYKMIPNQKFNDKPLYKKVDGDDYIYFWKFTDPDNGFGHNWIVR